MDCEAGVADREKSPAPAAVTISVTEAVCDSVPLTPVIVSG
jgi:hypothetical protein